jgi:hypothetical protein
MKNHKNPFHKRLNKDTKLTVECTLIGGLLPMFEIYYQDRKITGLFDRSIWGDEAAILEMAKAAIEYRHKFQPFKVATND